MAQRLPVKSSRAPGAAAAAAAAVLLLYCTVNGLLQLCYSTITIYVRLGGDPCSSLLQLWF